MAGSEMMMMMMMMVMMMVALSVVGGGGYWYYTTYIKEPENCVSTAWKACSQYKVGSTQYNTCRDESKAKCMANGGTWTGGGTGEGTGDESSSTTSNLKKPELIKNKWIFIWNRLCTKTDSGKQYPLLTRGDNGDTDVTVGAWHDTSSKFYHSQWMLIPTGSYYYIRNRKVKAFLSHSLQVGLGQPPSDPTTAKQYQWDIQYNEDETVRAYTIKNVSSQAYLSLWEGVVPADNANTIKRPAVTSGCADFFGLHMLDTPSRSQWVFTEATKAKDVVKWAKPRAS